MVKDPFHIQTAMYTEAIGRMAFTTVKVHMSFTQESLIKVNGMKVKDTARDSSPGKMETASLATGQMAYCRVKPLLSPNKELK